MAKHNQGSKFKKELNDVIRCELRGRGIRYVNMRQACSDLCTVLRIQMTECNFLEARRRIVEAITRKEPLGTCEVIKLPQVLKPRPTYLPGKLSRPSTLEHDIKAFYASWEWKQLSYDVKQERGRTCECCGAKPPHVRIITDHIKPIRHYWHLRFDRSNLQVLCDDCNMGKGSRDETDFRVTKL
jgi:hypothetical protein